MTETGEGVLVSDWLPTAVFTTAVDLFRVIKENKRLVGADAVTLGSTVWRAKCDTVQVAS
jgi:hypothetical protein